MARWRHELSSFVGRAAEQAAIAARLDVSRPDASRLVSLTGPGGCGKTRLALRIVDSVRPSFAEVELVELAPVEPGLLVPTTVAQALRVTDRAGVSPLDRVAEALADRELLLLLDNCEHVLEDAARLVLVVLERCPNVTVLATSRQRLAVPGEVVIPVLPLGLPAPDERTVEAIAASEAVRLFIDRAQAAEPSFALDEVNASVVAAICAQLDGIPLAIELAAARAGVLSFGDLLAHLDSRFGLLSGGTVAPARHKSLHALVQWSYDLLAPAEQRALAGLSVFRDGFDLDAARAVVGGDDSPGPDSVVAMVAGLVERSLVRVTHEGGTRYSLLETIRSFASGRLAELDSVGEFGRRHLDWALRTACAAEAELGGVGWQAWSERLAIEQGNMRVALTSALDGGDPSAGRQLAARLGRWWFVTGRYAEGREFLVRALDGAEDEPADIRARLLVAAGWCTYHLGDSTEAETLALRGLDAAHEAGDGFLAAWAQVLIAGVAWSAADVARVQEYLEGYETWTATAGAGPLAARAMVLVSNVRFIEGELDEARRLGSEAAGLARGAPGRENLALALIVSTHPTLLSGDLDAAGALLDEALAVATATGDSFSETIAHYQLAWLAAVRGDTAGAEAETARCWAAGRAQGVGVVDALGPFSQAATALSAGDISGAAAFLQVAVDDGRAMAFSCFEAGWLADRACLLARLGDDVGAVEGIRRAEVALAGREGRLAVAMLAYTRAVLAWHHGHLTEAQRHAGQAAAGWLAAGARLEAADGLETLGSLAIARGRYEEGVVLIGAAAGARRVLGYGGQGPAACRQEAAAAVGAATEAMGSEAVGRLLADGAELDLEAALESARRGLGGRKRPGVGWASLTPTEEQVVRLVAEGLRNDAIAQRLYLAPGTVKNHLSHIFAKTGVANRAELAVEAVRRDL